MGFVTVMIAFCSVYVIQSLESLQSGYDKVHTNGHHQTMKN
jgi:hypothetical protein